MSKSNNLGDFLTGIADAIRAKTGSSALIDPQDFDTEIANIPSGSKLPDVVNGTVQTLTEEDLQGATAIRQYAFYFLETLKEISIPSSITSIGRYAFSDCTSLANVTIGGSVTNIGNYAFQNCSKLKDIKIPNSVTTIGNRCFINCTQLKTVDIGNGVTSISDLVFYGCSAMTSVTILATTPPTLSSSNSFGGSYPIYVPAGSVSAYQSASQWSNLASRIQALTFANASWDFIRQQVRNGTASNYFAVGDTKTVTLTNGTTMTVRIADMTTGRYDFADGSNNKSNMVIEFVECFADTAKMNSTDTNVGGWANSEMRSTTMPTCLALLPQDIKDAMSEVLVLSGTGDSTTSGTSSSVNKLFLPCEWEIFGAKTYSIGSSEAGSSGQFEYYTAHNTAADRIKYRAGTAQVWWLRSPYSGDIIYFCTVNGYGDASCFYASAQRGFSPVFAI